MSFQPHDIHRTATVLSIGGVLTGGLLAALGVPGLDLHGPLHHVGVMDPLCGGTRAAYLLAHGDWAAAWTYNPVVFPLALASVLMLGRAAVGVLSGRWLAVRVANRRFELLSSDWTGSAVVFQGVVDARVR